MFSPQQNLENYCNDVQGALSLEKEKGTPVFSYPSSHLYVTALLRASCCFSRTLPTTTHSSPSPSTSAGTDTASMARPHPQAPPIAAESLPSSLLLPPIYSASPTTGTSAAPQLNGAAEVPPILKNGYRDINSTIQGHARYIPSAAISVTKQIPTVQDGTRRPSRRRHSNGRRSGSYTSPITAGEGSAFFRLSGSAVSSFQHLQGSPGTGNLSPQASWSLWNSSSFEKRSDLLVSQETDEVGVADRGGLVPGSLQSWVWVEGVGMETESSGTWKCRWCVQPVVCICSSLLCQYRWQASCIAYQTVYNSFWQSFIIFLTSCIVAFTAEFIS